jgi:hypothetical protein
LVLGLVGQWPEEALAAGSPDGRLRPVLVAAADQEALHAADANASTSAIASIT